MEMKLSEWRSLPIVAQATATSAMIRRKDGKDLQWLSSGKRVQFKILPDVKCPECDGRGTRARKVPRYAIAMPNVESDWEWKDLPCWRCNAGILDRSK